MATAQPTSVCPLCLESYIDPRKLPSCAHTFCVICLVTYITRLQDNKELKNGLPCPLCRTISPAPQEVVEPAVWVTSLEKDVTKLERYERTQQDCICASCHRQGKYSKATMYCFNCLEKLCEACTNARHTYIPIKDHKYINIGETFEGNREDEMLRMMAAYISCSSHPDKPVEFLCEDDEEYCCSICIVLEHRRCSSVLEVEKLSDYTDTTAEKDHIKDLINKLESYANGSIEKMNACISENKNQVETMIERSKDIREQINKLFDALENNCRDQSKAAAKKEAITVNEEIDKLKKVIDTLRQYKKFINAVDKYGSLGHQYVSAKRLKADVHAVELSIDNITPVFKSLSISLTQTTLLTDILKLGINDTDKLASVEEIRMKPVLQKYDSSTLLRNYKIIKVAETVVQENYQSKSSPTYSSLAFLPNNDFILVDIYIDTGHCLLATEDGNVVISCDFLSCGATSNKKPYCATVTRAGMIAVSLPELKKISLIRHDKLRITHTMDTQYEPRAICGLVHGDLAVAWNNPVAFGIISIGEVPAEKVYFCKDKSGRELKSFEYMAVDEKKSHVIQPCPQDRAVYCFDLEGSPKFKYNHTELKSPRGVALDRDGNIYVCDYATEVIHVISASGGGIRVVREGCPGSPAAMAFKKNGKDFAVTQHMSNYRTVTFLRLQKA